MKFPSPSFFLLLLLLLTEGARRLNAITAAVDDVNITALKRLCDKLKNEHFDIVYDEYGWSLEEMHGIDEVAGGGEGGGGGNASIRSLQGFCVDIFKEFVRLCPIDYRLYKNDDGLWGNYNESEQRWNGMVGKLVDGKADMALTYYYIQPHLVGVVDFSRAFLSSGIGIVMKNRPKAENSLRDFIINSFTFDGWMLIIGMFPVGIVAVLLIERLQPATKQYIERDAREANNVQLPDNELELSEYTPRILWFMSYALLGFDDVNRALHNAALRLMGLFWIFYFWVIFTLFSAQLTSNLTVGKMPRRVETFHDLLLEPGLKFFFDGADTQLKKNLQLHKSPIAQRLKRKFDSFGREHETKYRPSDTYLSSDDILNFTANGDAALLAEGIDVPVVMKNAFAFQCDIYMATDYTIKVDPAFAFRKGEDEHDKASLLREAFDLYLSIIIRTGDLDLVLSHWHIPYLGYNEEKCHLSALDSGETGISAKDLTSTSVACIVGMALSIIVAAIYRIRLKYFTTLEQHTNEVFMKELAMGVPRNSAAGGSGGGGGGGGSISGKGKVSTGSSTSAARAASAGEREKGRKSASFSSSL